LSDEGERKERRVSILTEEHRRTQEKISNKNERKKEKKIEFYDGDDG
jgi:hypothetical protein